MRIEIIIFGITAFLIANLYTDGKILKRILSWKKYYQMAGIALAGIFIYWLIKKNPLRAREMIVTSNEYMKYLPIDQNTSSMIQPILDFTSKDRFWNSSKITSNIDQNPVIKMPYNNHQERVIMNSGKKATKRSVSETKKKFVAARQNWKCGDCGEQLSAWFEVDHKIRLEYGGSNHVDNLLAMCRECHGKKTTIENL
jgi:5-methylcytosine-specific restriction endonuclease McrA